MKSEMHYSFQVLTTGANGTGVSSIICFKEASNKETKTVNQILINVGDGTQRFCSEHKIRLDKVSCIIFSSLSPQNVSGFQGIFLALSDLGKDNLLLCGPPGLKLIVDLMIPLINRKFPILTILEVDAIGEFDVIGGCVKVNPLFSNQSIVAISTIVSPRDSGNRMHGTKKSAILFYPMPLYFPVTPTLESVLSGECHRILIGALLPLTSCSVFDPETVRKLEETFCSAGIFGVIIKNELRREVIEFPQAQILIAAYGKACYPLFPRILSSDISLNKVDIFDVIRCGTLRNGSSLMLIEVDESILHEEVSILKTLHSEAEQFHSFVGRCHSFLQNLALVESHNKQESVEVDENREAVEDIIQHFNQSDLLDEILSFGNMGTIPPPNPFSDMFQIVFLGTGSSRPSKYRCNSCILISFTPNPSVSLLLDIGEGAMSQLFQSVSGNIERFYMMLLSIKIIWVSHHHGDHSSGFVQYMHFFQKAVSWSKKKNHGKVLVIAPDLITKYYEFMAISCGCEDFFSFQVTTRSQFAGLTSEISESSNGLITRLQSVDVKHCYQSYGVVIELSTGHKIVYSGDCRPSQSLVNCGMNCDLLIHEATFNDDKSSDALKKNHCTISEALNICRRMKAKHCILTHFSQRYPLLSKTSVEAFSGESNSLVNVGLAVDFFRLSFPSQVLHVKSATLQISESFYGISNHQTDINEEK